MKSRVDDPKTRDKSCPWSKVIRGLNHVHHVTRWILRTNCVFAGEQSTLKIKFREEPQHFNNARQLEVWRVDCIHTGVDTRSSYTRFSDISVEITKSRSSVAARIEVDGLAYATRSTIEEQMPNNGYNAALKINAWSLRSTNLLEMLTERVIF